MNLTNETYKKESAFGKNLKSGAIIIIAALLILAASVGYGQTTLYVDSSVAASGNGSSWAQAYKTLSQALDSAQNNSNTNYSILVAKGTYYPTGSQSGTNRDSTFAIFRGGLKIYGGYPSGGGARDFVANPTVLSGDIGTPGDSTDNSYHVMVVAGITATADSIILDGFRISDGNANAYTSNTFNGQNIERYNGAGMAVSSMLSPKMTIRSCTFSGNRANNDGGGMLNRDSSSPTLTNCSFSGNTADWVGGGMCNWDSCSPTLINCTFSGDRANWGGGMDNDDHCSPTLTNCTFSGNTAIWGGGGMDNDDHCSPTLINCSFSGNTTGWEGGGMLNRDSCSPTLINCSFSGNTTTDSIWGIGGGMDNDGHCSPTLTNCTFSGNTAGFWGGGGMDNDEHCSPTLTNCAFSGNTASQGGGMDNWYSCSPTLTNCIFSGNTASNNGGGMCNNSSGASFDTIPCSPTLTNCIFSGNTASNNGGGMYNSSEASFDTIPCSPTLTNCTFSGNAAGNNGGGMYNLDSCSPTLTNCIIYGNSSGIFDTLSSSETISYSLVQGFTSTTNGNLSGNTEPLFAAPVSFANAPTTAGNYRLQGGSPCINAGNNDSIPAGITTDLDGSPRIYDDTVDMGAYEYHPLFDTTEQIICAGDSFLFNSHYYYATGIFTDTLTGINGYDSLSVLDLTVTPLPVIPLVDSSFCQGDSIVLDAGNPGSSYLWNTGATTQTLTVSTAGSYSVTVTDTNACSTGDTVQVVAAPPVVSSFSISPRSPVYPNTEIIFTSTSTGATSYIWTSSDGQSSSDRTTQFKYNSKGNYSVCLGVTNNYGCKDSICQEIEVINKEVVNEIFIPNAFTPNTKDGINDFFFPTGDGIEKLDMYIFNRWGELIFQGHNLDSKWDGEANGTFVPPGVYVYKINIVNVFGGSHTYIGNVTVVK